MKRCQYCKQLPPHSKWCTRFGMKDSTVTLDKKPLDITFKKLDNDLLRRPLKTYSLLLDALND